MKPTETRICPDCKVKIVRSREGAWCRCHIPVEKIGNG